MTLSSSTATPIGTWSDSTPSVASASTNPGDVGSEIKKTLLTLNQSVSIIQNNHRLTAVSGGQAQLGTPVANPSALALYAWAPPLMPEQLGDPEFKKAHGLKYAYVMGAMANGITSAHMVIRAAENGMLGFYGAGGQTLAKISEAIDSIQFAVGGTPNGFNLIHSPADEAHEQATVDLYINKGVRLVSAAAYLRLTKPVVCFRVKGIRQNADGTIDVPNKIIAKVSRIEVARQFFAPPPEKILKSLVQDKLITQQEAELAKTIPMAEDMTAEADSGGHTDNRPALALLPTLIALRNEMMAKYQFSTHLRVGLGGGIATPESAAAAFAMGAAYILTGSVNQCCIESGTSDAVRKMLCQAQQADVTMTPSADMFEMGVKVQVLKRGTMFSMKAGKLYELYRTYESLDAVPLDQKKELEEKYFHQSLDKEWQSTADFFSVRDPKQLQRAAKDPKHKMALVFRSYLGKASMWAVTGTPDRTIDYQIWCGPAMGAFNEWVKGTLLEPPEQRQVAVVAHNLLKGAAFITRINWLKSQGIIIPPDMAGFTPEPLPA